MSMSPKKILLPLGILPLLGLNINEEFQPAENFQSVGDIGTVFLSIIFGLGAIFTVIFLILGGIKFITSGGDPNKTASAKNSITYAVIGMILLILTFVIMYTVQALFINNSNL